MNNVIQGAFGGGGGGGGSDDMPMERALKPGDGGGTSGGMEARVARLEAHVEHIRDEIAKLSGMPAEIATLKERIAHLPGKGFVVTASISTITSILALMTLLQHLGILR